MGIRQDRAIWLDYLRGFVTVLVVAHHSSLAYTTFASFNPQAYNASTHPIVDTARAYGLDLFEDFNDVFFMSLMFLISGVFVLPALARKGPRTFIRDRFYRLFIPCLIAVTFIMPLGYLASWHLAHGNYDLHAFLVDYIRIEHWPAGPPWFIGILFIFNLLIALCYNRCRPVLERWATSLAALSGRPFAIFWRGYALTLILFLPLVLLFGSSRWIGFGPFAFQLCRILLYLGYFVLGMIIGAAGTGNGLLADNSGLMRYPLLWAILCVLAYAALKLAGGYIQHWGGSWPSYRDPGSPPLSSPVVAVLRRQLHGLPRRLPPDCPLRPSRLGVAGRQRLRYLPRSLHLRLVATVPDAAPRPARSGQIRPDLRRITRAELDDHRLCAPDTSGQKIPVIPLRYRTNSP